MLSDEIIMRARYFLSDNSQVCDETGFIDSIVLVHKPKRSKFKSEVLDYFGTDRNFNRLDGCKQ